MRDTTMGRIYFRNREGDIIYTQWLGSIYKSYLLKPFLAGVVLLAVQYILFSWGSLT